LIIFLIKVHTVGWNSDGRYLASGSVDTLCKVWLLEKAVRIELFTFLFFFFWSKNDNFYLGKRSIRFKRTYK